jgi:hypothetical protein
VNAVMMVFGIFGIVVAVGGVVYVLWRRVQDRRARAADSADKLREAGLVFIPGALDAYARGDYRDAALKAHHAATVLLNPDTILTEFSRVLDRLVGNKSTREQLKAKIAAAEAIEK